MVKLLQNSQDGYIDFLSAGFSIFPVAFLGTSAKITFFGLLYLGSPLQNSAISSSLHSYGAEHLVAQQNQG